MTVGENIRLLRKKKNLTQKQLAAKCGLSIATIQGYEQGKYEPKDEAVIKLCEALNSKPSEIKGYTLEFIKPNNSLANLFSGASALAEEYEKNQKLKQISDSVNKNMQHMTTIAAHFDGTEYTEEELEEIKRFAEFIKSKRNK